MTTENGSRFEIYNGRPNEPYEYDDVAFQQEIAERSVATFAKVIGQEIEAGRIDPNQSQAAAASREKFGRPEVAEGKYGGLLEQ